MIRSSDDDDMVLQNSTRVWTDSNSMQEGVGGFNNFEHKMMQRMLLLACLGVQNDLIKAGIII